LTLISRRREDDYFARMRASRRTPFGLPLRTISEHVVRRSQDACFLITEQECELEASSQLIVRSSSLRMADRDACSYTKRKRTFRRPHHSLKARSTQRPRGPRV
jgi:hypothetical protein